MPEAIKNPLRVSAKYSLGQPVLIKDVNRIATVTAIEGIVEQGTYLYTLERDDTLTPWYTTEGNLQEKPL